MDHDGMREYINSSFGRALLDHLEIHCQQSKNEVVRLAQAKDYDPMDVRFRAGVSAGAEIILNAIRQLGRRPDAPQG